MKKLTINNLYKIHHSTINFRGGNWEITLTSETESGDGYNFVLVTDELDMMSIWVSNVIINDEFVKMICRWSKFEWVAYMDISEFETPDKLVNAIPTANWALLT